MTLQQLILLESILFTFVWTVVAVRELRNERLNPKVLFAALVAIICAGVGSTVVANFANTGDGGHIEASRVMQASWRGAVLASGMAALVSR